MKQGSGIRACEEAFERLVKGAANCPDHVGIESNKITAGVVSVEAGFDRGYLKKSRLSHRPLIARIEAHKKDTGRSGATLRDKVRRAEAKSQDAIDRLADMKVVLDKVLTENLMLVDRVIELEAELKRYQGTLPFSN